MSIVARVFVVLNLILSICFLIYAMQIWTAKTKWQKMYELERTTNIALKAANQKEEVELTKSNVQKEGVIKLRQEKIAELRVKVNELRDDILQKSGELAKFKSEANMQQALNEELTRELNRRADELLKLKGVLLKQQQAVQVARENEVKARNEKAEFENELNQVKQEFNQLARDKRKIESDLAEQTHKIQGLLDHGVPIYDILGIDAAATQPYVPDSLVLAVKPDLDLIMISVGAEQGVKPGFRFTISRGDQYVAKAQVEKVYKDMSSARLLLKKDEVQVHDEVKSRVVSGGQ
ncbi:MAG: hypothetical protein M5U26_13465 [Planctomycetota bacterium]|nr:hypothetical protein [Planctomycetota bacterium]